MPNRGTTNPNLEKLIIELKKMKKPFYTKVAEELERPMRQRAEVNLWKINKNTSDGETIIVPGKILCEGELDHKVTVSAFGASKNTAKKNLKVITIKELMKKNPEGTGVKILT